MQLQIPSQDVKSHIFSIFVMQKWTCKNKVSVKGTLTNKQVIISTKIKKLLKKSQIVLCISLFFEGVLTAETKQVLSQQSP
jgi:hypothetical protein